MGAYLKPKERADAKECLQILSNPWLTKRDLMKLFFMCDANAGKEMKKIKARVEEKGYVLPNGYVPSEEVIDYYKININLYKKLAREN